MARRRSKSSNGLGLAILAIVLIGWIGGCQKTAPNKDDGATALGADGNPYDVGPSPQSESSTLKPDGSRRLFSKDGSEIKVPSMWHPPSVKLLTATKLREESGDGSSKDAVIPIGTELVVKGVNQDQVYVLHGGIMQRVAASSTDFAEQMAAVHTAE